MNEENAKTDYEHEISTFKPNLRFRIGDLVTLKADLAQSIVFQVHWIFTQEIFDYKLVGVDGSKKVVQINAMDAALNAYTKQQAQ